MLPIIFVLRKKVTTEPVEQTETGSGNESYDFFGINFQPQRQESFKWRHQVINRLWITLWKTPVEKGGKLPESAEQRKRLRSLPAYSVENQAVFDSLGRNTAQ